MDWKLDRVDTNIPFSPFAFTLINIIMNIQQCNTMAHNKDNGSAETNTK